MSNAIVLFDGPDGGLVKVLVLSLNGDDNNSVKVQQAGKVPAEAQGLGAVIVSDHKALIVYSAPSHVDGEISRHPGSSGRDYTKMPVRTEGLWITSRKTTVYCAYIEFCAAEPHLEDSCFDALLGLDEQEYEPFGGIHLNRQGLAIIAGAHVPSIAEIPGSTIYYMPLSAIAQKNPLARKKLQPPGFKGASYCPRISHDGRRLVYLQKRRSWLEDEANLVVICDDLEGDPTFTTYEIYQDEAHEVLLSPQKVETTPDWSGIYLLAEDRAEMRLFYVRLAHETTLRAEPLTFGWSILAFHLLGSTILLSGNTMTNPRHWAILDISKRVLSTISTGTTESDRLELNKVTFESIEWPGADDLPVQAWIVKPRDFDPAKRYPLLYCVHGGPNAAFTSAWAANYWANWNFVLYAEQGYVVVAPNFSGSTGFGEKYARRVMGEWGGKPYVDLERGLDFIQQNLFFVDTSRAIALGISYGGFLVNWIQGQPLGRRFRALVVECGFGNTTALYVSLSD